MNYKLFILCSMISTAHSANYRIVDLFLLATDPNDAAKIYTLVPKDDINKSRPAKAKVAENQALFDAAASKSSAAGAPQVGCMTKAEAETILQAKLPDVNTPTDAKNAVDNYFKASETGGKLLAEICENPQDANDVRAAIHKIKPKQ
jgi:hypothetical protein